MSNHDSHTTEAALRTRISKRKLEWRVAAAFGALLFTGSFMAMRELTDLNSSVIITLMLLPLGISALLRRRMQARSDAVRQMLRSKSHPVAADYATNYETLLSSATPSEVATAQEFRRYELFWAASSLYALSAIVAIFFNFISR